MFTGIIEEVGVLQEFSLGNGFGVVEIQCSTVLEDTKIGDSIATNGVCLTVKEKSSNSFKAEIMAKIPHPVPKSKTLSSLVTCRFRAIKKVSSAGS